MLDVLVREAFATRALRQSHTFSKCLVIGFAVRGVQGSYGIPTFDADGHRLPIYPCLVRRCCSKVRVRRETRSWWRKNSAGAA